ncbi:hypothetical protein SDC9_146173 [bioreactor metagenome]|uniref:Uncharacterized protein n=1 Tax=bioreactor metagenome TaxID=1076179 RepID=A0A645EDY9_9ZZZZ
MIDFVCSDNEKTSEEVVSNFVKFAGSFDITRFNIIARAITTSETTVLYVPIFTIFDFDKFLFMFSIPPIIKTSVFYQGIEL